MARKSRCASWMVNPTPTANEMGGTTSLFTAHTARCAQWHNKHFGHETIIMQQTMLTLKTAKSKPAGVETGRELRQSPKHGARKVVLTATAPATPMTQIANDARSLKVKWRPDLTALKLFILNRGGQRFEHHDFWAKQFNRKRARRLIEEGQFVPGKDAVRFEVNMGTSHLRAILLGADPRAQRWSGFALGEDGCWRWHSWIVRSKDHRVIETTADRFILYFGVQEPVPARYMKPYAELDIAKNPAFKALFEGSLPMGTVESSHVIP